MPDELCPCTLVDKSRCSNQRSVAQAGAQVAGRMELKPRLGDAAVAVAADRLQDAEPYRGATSPRCARNALTRKESISQRSTTHNHYNAQTLPYAQRANSALKLTARAQRYKGTHFTIVVNRPHRMAITQRTGQRPRDILQSVRVSTGTLIDMSVAS